MPFKNVKEISNPRNGSIYIIGKSVLIAYIISLLLLVLYGLLLAITSLSETTLSTAVMIITMASIAVSGIYAAIKAESKGFIYGAIVGLVYMVILFFLSLLFGIGVAVDKYLLFRVFMGVVIGALAGIIGVNLK